MQFWFYFIALEDSEVSSKNSKPQRICVKYTQGLFQYQTITQAYPARTVLIFPVCCMWRCVNTIWKYVYVDSLVLVWMFVWVVNLYFVHTVQSVTCLNTLNGILPPFGQSWLIMKGILFPKHHESSRTRRHTLRYFLHFHLFYFAEKQSICDGKKISLVWHQTHSNDEM